MKLHRLSIGLSGLVLLGIMGYMVMEYIDSGSILFALFFSLTFCGFPLITSMVISVYPKNWISQVILMIASLLYGIFFALVAYDLHIHPDNQGGLVFIFIGFFSLPVLIPLWLIASVIEYRHRRRTM